MVRFVHTADWQLGMTRHFLDADAQARFSAARIEAIRSIGRLAVERDCSFVVVCGDVFETNHVERQVIVRALDAMAASPDVKFYLLPGNHDPLTASSVFTSQTFVSHCPENVEVLDAEGATEVDSGVELIAAPWTSKAPLEDLVSRARSNTAAGDGVRIVVAHGAVDVLNPDANDPSSIQLESLESAIADGQIHYVALGDRHSTTSVGKSGRVWYSGAPEPTAYPEIDPGNVLVVEIENSAVEVTAVPVGEWVFRSLEFDLRSAEDINRLESELSDLESKSLLIVRLTLVGQLSLGDKIRLDSILEHLSDLFASLNTWERHSDLVILPDDDDFTSLGLSGFAQDALAELVELASDDEAEASNAQEALGLLYRLAGGSA
ncbi:MAG: metallophosphoesterase [Actinomycetota bacterium]|nr:metallophosphoesterase [Actinomycetota bacterium]